MAFSGPLADRIEIRELIETYSDAVMRGEADDWSQTWAEESFWSLPEYPGHEAFVGRDAIVAGWKMSMALVVGPQGNSDKPTMIYVSTPGAIEVDGDSATARVYTSEVYKMPDSGAEVRVRGQYDDELRRIDGKWLFTKRIYKTLHSSQSELLDSYAVALADEADRHE